MAACGTDHSLEGGRYELRSGTADHRAHGRPRAAGDAPMRREQKEIAFFRKRLSGSRMLE
ncbi:hypothetical protein Rsph17029_3500 [Rhodobacter sphaeroides ATCC 17029]|nr:hypothetical protein Rsph17029_3500 [Cereibacter sphaeroides ATCC 17029]